LHLKGDIGATPHKKKVINAASWPSLNYKNQSNIYEKEVIRGINSFFKNK